MNERGVFCNHSLQLRTGYVDYLKRIAGVRLNGLAHFIEQHLAIIRVDIVWQHQGKVNLAVGRRFTAGNGTEVRRVARSPTRSCTMVAIIVRILEREASPRPNNLWFI